MTDPASPLAPLAPVPESKFRASRGRCTRCGSYELHRSRPRNAFERLLRSTTPFTPMRCPACGRRELRNQSHAEPWTRPAQEEDPAAAPPGPEGPKRHRRRGRRARKRLMRRLFTFGLAVVLASAVGYAVGGR